MACGRSVSLSDRRRFAFPIRVLCPSDTGLKFHIYKRPVVDFVKVVDFVNYLSVSRLLSAITGQMQDRACTGRIFTLANPSSGRAPYDRGWLYLKSFTFLFYLV